MKRLINLLLMVPIAGIFIVLCSQSAIAETYGDLTYKVSQEKVIIQGCSKSATGAINIPDKINGYPVTEIGDEAFWNCDNLTSVTIPDSVISIGDGAFLYCDRLTNVTIGNGVTSIGDCAFGYCKSLSNITVDEDNMNYSSIDGNLFDKNKTTLITYAPRKTDTQYTIPDSVTSIGDKAFNYCDSLTSVTIPDSVISIGDSAFYNCYNLRNVYYTGSEEQWKKISIASDNQRLTDANIEYNSITNDGKLIIKNLEITQDKIKFSVETVKLEDTGVVYVAAYDSSGVLLKIKEYYPNDLSEDIPVKLSNEGNILKVMWWEESNAKPIAETIKINLKD